MLRRKFLIASFIFFAIVFQGCMPTITPFAPVQVKPDKVLVYIYRPESIVARGSTWSLLVNEQKFVNSFINNGYIVAYANPGDINIVLYHDNGIMASYVYDEITLRNAQAGDVYYVKAFMEFAGNPHFELKDRDVGAKEISETSYYDYSDKK